MTRQDKLLSMTGATLIGVADSLGVKVICNKTRTALKESKAAVVERILIAEGKNEETEPIKPAKQETPANKPAEHKLVPMPGIEKLEDLKKEYSKPEKKRGALLEYNGKSQNICAWAKELGVSANTLYGRIYKLGWSLEKAFGGK